MNKMFVPAVLALALLASCGKQGAAPTSPGASAGQFSVTLTDAPAPVQAIHIDVTSVLAHHAGQADGTGWELLSSTEQDVDLLSYQNGAFLTLASATVPVGGYDAFRLVLGTGCSITVDNVTKALTIPAGAEAGLKIQGNYTVDGSGLNVHVDFDASQSLKQAGNGKWSLRPVLRALPANASGAIQGVVASVSSVSGVDVLQDGAIVTSVVPGTNGHFGASVLPAGTYNVVIHTSGGDLTLSNVVVASGATTNLGTISFAGSSLGGSGGGGPHKIDG